MLVDMPGKRKEEAEVPVEYTPWTDVEAAVKSACVIRTPKLHDARHFTHFRIGFLNLIQLIVFFVFSCVGKCGSVLCW